VGAVLALPPSVSMVCSETALAVGVKLVVVVVFIILLLLFITIYT
jgi:hypothetical protein